MGTARALTYSTKKENCAVVNAQGWFLLLLFFPLERKEREEEPGVRQQLTTPGQADTSLGHHLLPFFSA